MKIYILKVDWNNCEAGTRFFLQDNMYYGKTITETDIWLSVEDVENSELFRPITIIEFVYYTSQK